MVWSRRSFVKVLPGAAACGFAGFRHEGEASLAADPSLPSPGDEVDLALFGRESTWDGNPGVEWDEPRDLERVEADFQDETQIPSERAIRVEYWVSSWPALPAGGWTNTDSPWQGEWRTVATSMKRQGNTLVFHVLPLTETENPNAHNAPGFQPSFRRTLKLRVNCSTAPSQIPGVRIYGRCRWNVREINIQSGCEGKEQLVLSTKAYNGMILDQKTLNADPPGLRLRLLHTEHPPSYDDIHKTEHDPYSNDRTIVTVQAGEHAFGVSIDDVIRMKSVYVRPLGVFLGDAAVEQVFAGYLKSGNFRPGEDLFSRTSRHAEQTLDQAISEIPSLALAARSAHPHGQYRYIPLGFPGCREKYRVQFQRQRFYN